MPTAARSEAYGRVMQTLRDLGPTKLHPAEQDLIRDAADVLFFCEDVLTDEAATDAVADVGELTTRLVEADRWTGERAEQLLSDIVACGPAYSPAQASS